MPLRGHVGVTWGHFEGTLGLLWRHFGHIDVEWHVQCISYRIVSGPNGSINRKYTFADVFCLSKKRKAFSENEQPGERNRFLGHFGVTLHTLDSLWATFGIGKLL